MSRKTYSEAIRKTPLFNEIKDEELEFMLDCLSCEARAVHRNEVLLLAGDKPQYIGVVLSGLIHVVKEDSDGNRTLVAAIPAHETFGETLCYAGVDESPITVFAADESRVLLLRYDRIVHLCQQVCGHHQKLIENMLRLVAGKNLYLQERIEIISIKSVRAKVMRYLESLATKQGRAVVIPFSQTKLAEYLCVERSALAHELSRMKKDGLIDYRRNAFTLLRNPE